MKTWFKQRFGRDWKFFWMQDSFVGDKYKKVCDFVGFKLLIFSRKLMRIGRKRCSYCGEEQNRNTGLHMSASKKGLRCGNTPVECGRKPYV